MFCKGDYSQREIPIVGPRSPEASRPFLRGSIKSVPGGGKRQDLGALVPHPVLGNCACLLYAGQVNVDDRRHQTRVNPIEAVVVVQAFSLQENFCHSLSATDATVNPT